MIAVITGDIIGSRKVDNARWMDALTTKLTLYGTSPKDWAVYRGDEFQLEIAHPEQAMLIAIQLKACMRTFKNLDVRMAIGLGDKSFQGISVTQSNGSAFSNSGTQFNLLKNEKTTLAIQSNQKEFDEELNLMLKLALVTMDNWSTVSAELADIQLSEPHLLQEEIATKLRIRQSAVSQRANRAKLNLMIEFIDFFQSKLKKTFPA